MHFTDSNCSSEQFHSGRAQLRRQMLSARGITSTWGGAVALRRLKKSLRRLKAPYGDLRRRGAGIRALIARAPPPQNNQPPAGFEPPLSPMAGCGCLPQQNLQGKQRAMVDTVRCMVAVLYCQLFHATSSISQTGMS